MKYNEPLFISDIDFLVKLVRYERARCAEDQSPNIEAEYKKIELKLANMRLNLERELKNR